MPVGARSLSALAVPMNIEILMTLAGSPLSASELLAAVGDPPRTTAQKRLRELVEFGALRRRRRREFPRRTIYELTPDGEQLLELAEAVGRWLAEAPKGRAALDSPRGKELVQTLVAGWSSSIIASIADRPCSLTDLDRLVDSIPYPSLERRLVALREVGLIRIAERAGRGTPYEATDWLRRAAAPLLAAATLEQKAPADELVRAAELRAVLLLTMPLLELPQECRGILAIVVYPEAVSQDVPRASAPKGATLEVHGGRVVGIVAEIDDRAPNWVLGTPASWFDAALNGTADCLRIGGHTPRLGADLVKGLHDSLVGVGGLQGV